MNAILKQHLAKSFATMPRDIISEARIRCFIWDELEKVRSKLKGSRVMYSIIPELEKALRGGKISGRDNSTIDRLIRNL